MTALRTPELGRAPSQADTVPTASLRLDIHVSGDLQEDRLRGGERHGLDLARALRQRGHQVRFFCRGPQASTEQRTVDGFPVVRLPAAPAPPLLWRLARPLTILASALEIRRQGSAPDVTIALSPWSVLSCRIARPGSRILYLMNDLLCASKAFDEGHTFQFPTGGWMALGLDAWLEQRAYLSATKSVVCSRWLLEGLAASGVPRERLSVLPLNAGDSTTPTVDRAQARAKLGLPPDSFIVIYAGALTRRKNARLLVEALAASRPSVCAVFAGDGPDRAPLETRAKELGVADRARFLGWMSDPATAYAAADVLCHPALYETYGLIYPEAMRAGLPPVAPRHQPPDVYSTAPEIFEDGVAGVFFDATRASDLGAQLSSLAADPNRVRQMAERARATAATFTWTAYAAAVDRELTALTATTPAAGRRAST